MHVWECILYAVYCTVVDLNTPKPAGLGGKDGVLTVSPAVGGLERLPARQH